MQSAAVIGVNGLNPLAVLIFASPVTLLDHSGSLARRIGLPVAMLAVLAAMALFGSARLAERTQDAVTGVRLRLMQPNIPQHEKWAGENRLRIFQTYLDVSARNPSGAADGLQGITHLIWPESSVPFLLLQSREALDAIAALLPPGALLVTGALRAEQPEAGALNPDLSVYNSLAVIDSEGLPLAVYDKRHLVPFGEYLPFQATLAAIGLEPLTRLRGSLAAGTNARLLAIPGTPVVVPLICYEAIFPREVASPGDRAGWLLNVTNDAWFGASAGPYQHLHQARVRAVEQGLPMVRVANTGVSAVIDPWGRILASLPLGTRGSIDSTLPAAGPFTPYSTHGDLSLWLLLVSGLTVLAARALIRPAGSGD
jgi:apolipoprotein N-acyltransferase